MALDLSFSREQEPPLHADPVVARAGGFPREDKLKALELEPMAYLVGWAAVGCNRATMAMGPVPAVRKRFEKTGLGFERP